MLGAKVIDDDSCRLTVVRSLENTYFYFYFSFPWCIVFCANTLTLPILQVVDTQSAAGITLLFRSATTLLLFIIYYIVSAVFSLLPLFFCFLGRRQQHIELFILYRVCQSCCCRVPPNLVRLDYFGVRCV